MKITFQLPSALDPNRQEVARHVKAIIRIAGADVRFDPFSETSFVNDLIDNTSAVHFLEERRGEGKRSAATTS